MTTSEWLPNPAMLSWLAVQAYLEPGEFASESRTGKELHNRNVAMAREIIAVRDELARERTARLGVEKERDKANAQAGDMAMRLREANERLERQGEVGRQRQTDLADLRQQLTSSASRERALQQIAEEAVQLAFVLADTMAMATSMKDDLKKVKRLKGRLAEIRKITDE